MVPQKEQQETVPSVVEEQDTSIEQMYYFQVLFHFSAMIFVELFSNISNV